MALQSAFKQFLAAPNTTFLTDNASLHYITTLVTCNGSAEIIKHLNSQIRQLKKKEEKFLDVIEGQNALAVEVETSMEFLTGGGAYLPGLDDNFLADRVVTFPIIHIVNFDGNGKITQMRQNWDQGSLLKLIDVIGKTGRNWPIRDGKDQIKLITSSVKSAGRPAGGANQAAPRQQEIVNRSRENSTNVTRDPHASLALFAPRDPDAEASLPAVVAPRASAKPPPRDYHDLFVGNGSDPSKQDPPVTERAESPSKFSVGIAKAGAGRSYQPIRLFETEENQQASPEKNFPAEHFYRPNPKKYQHFDFADGTDPQDAPQQAPAPTPTVKSKHGSQWKFDDFNTPAKVIPTTKVLRGQDVRHWGNEEDPVMDSPIKQKKLDKPRKDAETHFEFVDDGTPEGTRRIVGRPRGAGHNAGLGLYKNDLFDEDNEAVPPKTENRVLGNIANVKDRRKDFDPHFAIADHSPSVQGRQTEKLPEDKLRGVKTEPSWAATDSSASTNQKENAAPAPTSPIRPGTGKGPLSESTNTMSKRNDNPKGISIGGDGMGGKKGAGRSWGIGDDSEGEEVSGLNGAGKKFSKGVPGKKQGTSAQTGGGDFWNF